MDQSTASNLISVYRDGLLNDTLPFWLKHGPDQEFGGIITSLDRDGSVVDTDKGVWQQGRYCWLLGECYNNVERRDEWLEALKQGISFLDQHCFDAEDGRMWFQLARDGTPIRKRRYSYGESFAAIAYGELPRRRDSRFMLTKRRGVSRNSLNTMKAGRIHRRNTHRIVNFAASDFR